MRKLILLLFSILLPALAQDIQLRERGPYLTLGRNLLWGVSGAGGIHNTWVFTPQNPDQGICIFVTNNSTSTKEFSIRVYQTGDTGVPQYTGYERKFREDEVRGQYSPVEGLSTVTAFVQTAAAAKVAVRISDSSPGGTADLFVVQTSAGTCGPVQSGATIVQGSQPFDEFLRSNPVVIAGLRNVDERIRPLRIRDNGSLLVTDTEGELGWSILEVPTTEQDLVPREGQTYVNIKRLFISNSNSSPITFTLKCAVGPSTYYEILNNVQIPGNTAYLIAFNGLTCSYYTGTEWIPPRWQASNTGVYSWIKF